MTLTETLNLLMMEARLDPELNKYDTNTLVLILTRTNLVALMAAASDVTERFTDMSDFNFGAFVESMLDNLEWIDKNIEGVDYTNGNL